MAKIICRSLFLTGLAFFFLLCPARASGEDSYSAYLKGITAAGEGDLSLAESYLEDASRLDPRSSNIWNALAKIYLQENKFQEAVTAYNRAKSLNPGNKEVYYGLGLAYLRLKKNTLARLQYETLIKNSPDEKEAYLLLADLYTSAGLTDAALNTYRQILKFLPDNPIILYNYAVLLAQQKDYRSAQSYLIKATGLMPNFIPARALLAKIYWETGNRAAAKENYRQILEMAPLDQGTLFNLARICLEENKWTEAGAHLEKIANPKNDELLRLLGFVYRQNKEPEKALLVFQQALDLRDDPRTRFYLALTLDDLKRDTEATEQLYKAISQDPENDEALNYLGYTLVERGEKLGEAEQLIKEAVRLEPENGAYLDSLGWLYFKKGNFSFARYYLLKAIRLEPDPEIYQHLAELYQRLGDTKKAEYYREKSNPSPTAP
ncbi:MAG: tetratricopeptide repeat protein [Candidatus Omnitrophica bacterium]|nr:tetratricopeptide repeat protein [Candidatus Omnitrophota bacterium]